MKLPWITISLIGWALIAIYVRVPTSAFYELRDVYVTDEYALLEDGKPHRVMTATRDIKANFYSDYQVDELAQLSNGKFVSVRSCRTVNPVRYRVDNDLPEITTVDWWTWGRCDSYPPIYGVNYKTGKFKMCTWHTIYFLPELPFLKKTTEAVCSNLYTGRAL